jgi:hypothetical protein
MQMTCRICTSAIVNYNPMPEDLRLPEVIKMPKRLLCRVKKALGYVVEGCYPYRVK